MIGRSHPGGVRPLGCATSRLSAPRAEAARVHRVASGRSTRSARRLGDTEIGFEVGLRAASPETSSTDVDNED